MALNINKFNTMAMLVIDKLEGGYYHPDMLKDGRVKDPRYANSGETMFGIDRKAGGKINDTTAGKAFWKIIDEANARKLWKWNFKGGNLAPVLKKYVAEIILPEYEKLAKLYLSEKAKEVVGNDSRLLFHFIYATWNGSGWFKKFASDINKAIDNGVKDSDKLTQVALNSRTKEGLKPGSQPNSLVAQGGNKIATFINDLKDKVTENKGTTGALVVGIILLGIGYQYKDNLKQLIS